MQRFDVLIIGAGPAGLSSAIEAAELGMKVALFDENRHPGGQLFKQIHKFFGSKEHKARIRGFKIGEELLKQANELGVKVFLNTTVAGIFANKEITVMHDNHISHYKGNSIILASGASENGLPFEGWTLPGVMGAGAAQTLANLYREKPGQNILMVGSGNVGLVVSYQLAQAGCHVAALIDVLPRIGGYGVHAAKIARTGIPIYTSHTIVKAEGTDHVTGAIIAKVGPDFKPILGTEEHIAVDTICLAVGLTPQSKLASMAGCTMTIKGGTVPTCDEYGVTSLDGLFAAGDVSGIEEASSAMIEGKISALSAAKYAGFLPEDSFKKQMAECHGDLMKLRHGMFAPGNPEKMTATKTTEGYPLSMNLLENGSVTAKDVEAFPNSGIKASGIHPVIECTQNIPCNPCQDICPHHCIMVGEDITKIPQYQPDHKCVGCGLCVANCPGQAIFLVENGVDRDKVTIPYEFFPLPHEGEKGHGCNRAGKITCEAEVISVKDLPVNDHTVLLTLSVPAGMGNEIRFYKN